MTDAYVNVHVDTGAVSDVAADVADVPTVSTVHVVTGEYDLVAQLELDDLDDLPHVVADHVHDVPGVADTVTNVAFEP